MSHGNQQTPGISTSGNYRLDGIYAQRQTGFFMQRVKLAAGIISSDQARTVAKTAATYGQDNIHLTTRGSMEIHWLKESDLPNVKRALAAAGLTSRGACGGAVRGVTCASQGSLGFPAVESLARAIHRHFTGNPRYERLPKKFKIGVEADIHGKRHLIQDLGLVLAAEKEGVAYFDVYAAGGLGREPQAGFLFESTVNENRIIPLIEAIARVYAAGTAAGKRLKHLIREIGIDEFRKRVMEDPGATEELPPVSGIKENFIPAVAAHQRITANIAAGELTGHQLATLADFADRFSDNFLMVTADQDIVFHLNENTTQAEAVSELQKLGFASSGVVFRVCPGSSTCLVGLSNTRDVAAQLVKLIGKAEQLTWAISGCPNSCTQPQLSDVGIVTSSLTKENNGERTPRFDLYRSGNSAFGDLKEKSLTLDQLCGKVQEILE